MSPLSKNRIKYVRSLESKKGRKEEGAFLAEGNKIVGELVEQFDCLFLAATPEWLAQHPGVKAREVCEVSHEDLSKASLLKTPQQVLGVFRQPSYSLDKSIVERTLCLALDDVQDPGNLGTIIRIADWFGIEDIFCSIGTVDVYNPKVVQATMGAIARVRVHYVNLPEFISSVKGTPVYGTFLDGKNMYGCNLSSNGLIVMGNEGNGIGHDTEALITNKLYIPNYPADRATSESLNVAVATAIVCAEFRRRMP
jgi:TrmH family RNA methyltransferase